MKQTCTKAELHHPCLGFRQNIDSFCTNLSKTGSTEIVVFRHGKTAGKTEFVVFRHGKTAGRTEFVVFRHAKWPAGRHLSYFATPNGRQDAIGRISSRQTAGRTEFVLFRRPNWPAGLGPTPSPPQTPNAAVSNFEYRYT